MHRRTITIAKNVFLYWAVLGGFASLCMAFPSVTKIGDTTVASNAMTLSSPATYGQAINGLSFQQEALMTFNGWQYITYYNSSRYVCVGRRQLPDGPWQILTLTDYTLSTTWNAHNTISMGICPNDGTIHLSFDHHSSTLRYRVSQAGVATNPASVTWSASLFGPVRNILESGQSYSTVTYPRFWPTPDGNLQFGYRIGSSGNGDWAMVDYNAASGQWTNTRTVIGRTGTYTDSLGSSTVRNPYLNGPIGYGPDGTLHLTWTWRETAGGANHDILYACSKDGGFTWYNNEPARGLRIGTGPQPVQTMVGLTWMNEGLQIVGRSTGNSATQMLILLDSPGIRVVTLDRYYGMMNQQAQAVDPQGRIHTVMFHCTPETYQGYTWSTWGPQGARRYYHYWRDSQGAWHRNELPGWVGSRPKLFIRSNGDAFVIYQSRRTVNLNDTGIYFIDGDLTIQAATAASQWTDWQIIHVEPGYFLNEALGDKTRFEQGVLSVMMQESPASMGAATKLRVLDFQLNN